MEREDGGGIREEAEREEKRKGGRREKGERQTENKTLYVCLLQ